jgi:hypothetical protein
MVADSNPVQGCVAITQNGHCRFFRFCIVQGYLCVSILDQAKAGYSFNLSEDLVVFVCIFHRSCRLKVHKFKFCSGYVFFISCLQL